VGDRVTLQTLADRLGVSRTTASNAFNRPDQLNPALREKVLALAAELGYAGPDPAGRALRSGRAGEIGVLLTEQLSYAFADPAAVATLRGLAVEAEQLGISLSLLPAPLSDGVADPAAVKHALVDACFV
jgi:DNA-binding LacI/PurR family transcriptional regulator